MTYVLVALTGILLGFCAGAGMALRSPRKPRRTHLRVVRGGRG